MPYRTRFVQAIRDRQKLRITFFSKEDNGLLARVCAPMDIAPGQNIRDNEDRYWVWDFESDKANHTLPLRPERIRAMVVLQERFDPADFMAWPPNWTVPRDWGPYS